MDESAKAKRRLERFRELLTHVSEQILPGVGFELWDKSTVPAQLAPNIPVIALADEGVVAAMVRRPNIHTLLNLYVTARLDIKNGTLFDLVALKPKLRSREIVKRLNKRLLLTTAAKFLTVPRGGPWPLEAIRGDKARDDGSEATNKENVHYHYDLSNAFYALFLDPEMVYTCAYFKDWNNDIATAQRDKLDMICRKLRLKPGERMLDIGCGWGSLIIHAAKNYGVHAHGVTLAQEQFAYAKDKVARLGLQDKVTLELRDYTAVEGPFDKIASIGMFEQVGRGNYPTYYSTVYRLLNPGGLYLHHSIVLRAREYQRSLKNKSQALEYIGRYIFPGGALDHIAMSIENLELHNFEVHDVEAWREHYARTTRLWHDRLGANSEAADREVGSARRRLWMAYLAVSSMAFQHGSIGIFQTLVSKRIRGASGMPPTRADLYR